MEASTISFGTFSDRAYTFEGPDFERACGEYSSLGEVGLVTEYVRQTMSILVGNDSSGLPTRLRRARRGALLYLLVEKTGSPIAAATLIGDYILTRE